MADPEPKNPKLVIDLNDQPGHWLVPGSGNPPRDDERKKPELTTIRGKEMTVENLEAIAIRLTGKSFTPEERARAEKIALEYMASAKPDNEPGSSQ